MFSKPLHFILVYIMTVVNVTLVFCPLVAAIVPFVNRRGLSFSISQSVFDNFMTAFYFLVFLVSVCMLLYFFLDLIFGFSIRSLLKKSKRYEKIKEYAFLKQIFEQTKQRFGEKYVQLYVKQSDEVNAFAVASFGRRVIILSDGLIQDYLRKSKDSQEFLTSIRSIMGHEMSHLVNKDFMPSYMIIANQSATNFVSFFLRIIFTAMSKIVLFIPYGGRFLALFMNEIYSILNFILRLFNKYAINVVYEFLRKWISRSVEYRCDRQAGQAFGGAYMAKALSFLGESGYLTIFATHPSTKSRIKKVQNVKVKNSTVRPGLIESLSNYFAFLMLFIICLYFAKQAGVDMMIRYYIRQHEQIHTKLKFLWELLKGMI